MSDFKQPQIEQPRVNIEDTEMVTDDNCAVYNEGFILRKANRFLVGSDRDQYIPIPIIFNVKTGKPLFEMIPQEVRQEYIDFYKNQK